MSLDAPFLIIGHRGAAGLEPENTLRSFERAIALGVDAVELDVRSVDAQLLVIHDDEVDRTTDGAGSVYAQSFAALRALDAGAGQQIPTLAEVLDLVAGRCAVNVELKGQGAAAPVAELLALYPTVQLLVSSFRHDELWEFAGLRPEVPIAPLYGRSPPDLTALKRRSPWSINIARRAARPTLLRSIVAAGYRCLVYTVNDPEEAKQLHQDGAAGVFTDFPDRVSAT